MNKNIFCLICLAFVVAACGKEVPQVVTDCDNFDVSNCDVVVIPEPCEGKDTGQHFVTVNVQPTPIVVAPPNRCIDTGEFGREVTFNIAPASLAEGTVWICPKDPANTWLKETNSPDNRKIIIEVPQKDYPEDGEEYH